MSTATMVTYQARQRLHITAHAAKATMISNHGSMPEVQGLGYSTSAYLRMYLDSILMEKRILFQNEGRLKSQNNSN